VRLLDEICEQPQVARRLLDRGRERIEAIAEAVRAHEPGFVYLVARGSSDNAGVHAKYLLGMKNGLPVALAAPSLFTLYESPPRIDESLVLGLSQSGQSPDLVKAVQEGRRQGALTVVFTNAPESPLARAAEHVLPLEAGDEVSVAATKSYTATLLAVAMLSAALRGKEGSRTDWTLLDEVPKLLEETLALQERDKLRALAESHKDDARCAVIGRGLNYSTAYEWSLKLEELASVSARPFSSADFRHGPIAQIGPGFPALLVHTEGRAGDDVLRLAVELERRRADIVLLTTSAEAASCFEGSLLAAPADEALTPILLAVPAQLFAVELALARGLDPEKPVGLTKVTTTE